MAQEQGTARFYTVQEVARLLSVPASWVYSHLSEHSEPRLPHHKIGRYVRFSQREINAWVAANHCG